VLVLQLESFHILSKGFKTLYNATQRKSRNEKRFCFQITKKAFQILSFLCVVAPWRLERPEEAGVSTGL
jgi:hypothetical protein